MTLGRPEPHTTRSQHKKFGHHTHRPLHSKHRDKEEVTSWRHHITSCTDPDFITWLRTSQQMWFGGNKCFSPNTQTKGSCVVEYLRRDALLSSPSFFVLEFIAHTLSRHLILDSSRLLHIHHFVHYQFAFLAEQIVNNVIHQLVLNLAKPFQVSGRGRVPVLHQTHRHVSTHFHCQFPTPIGILSHSISTCAERRLHAAVDGTFFAQNKKQGRYEHHTPQSKHRKLGKYEHHTTRLQKLKLTGHEHSTSTHPIHGFPKRRARRAFLTTHTDKAFLRGWMSQRPFTALMFTFCVSGHSTSTPSHHFVLDSCRPVQIRHLVLHPLMFLGFRWLHHFFCHAFVCLTRLPARRHRHPHSHHILRESIHKELASSRHS